jgi:hypothetical protein
MKKRTRPIPEYHSYTDVYSEMRIPQPSAKIIRKALLRNPTLQDAAVDICKVLHMDDSNGATRKYYRLQLKNLIENNAQLPQLPEFAKKESTREKSIADFIASFS